MSNVHKIYIFSHIQTHKHKTKFLSLLCRSVKLFFIQYATEFVRFSFNFFFSHTQIHHKIKCGIENAIEKNKMKQILVGPVNYLKSEIH